MRRNGPLRRVSERAVFVACQGREVVMEFTIGLAQCCHPADESIEAVVASVREWCARARAHGVDLLVFPEELMTRFEGDRDAYVAAAQTLDGPFCRAMDALAREYGLWLVYTVNETNAAGKPFNTAVIADAQGVQRGVYRKAHLFDSAATCESERMAAGECLFDPIDTPFGRIGLAICYDLRFPEVARRAALAGCEVLIIPAAWVDGRLKAEQWKTLLAARAIENELFVAGVGRVDVGCVGQSAVFSPDGVVIAHAGDQETLLTARIDTARIERVRAAIPVFKHRRPELYGLHWG